MNKIGQLTGRRPKSWAVTLSMFALALVLSQPEQAQAQWATNGNNINNTNTGNVGIGTSSPANKLDVAPVAGDGLHLRSTGSDTNTSDVTVTNRGITITTAGFTSPNTYTANFGNPSAAGASDSGGVLMTVSNQMDTNTTPLLTLYNRNQQGFTQGGYFLKATGSLSADKFWLSALGNAYFAGNVGIGTTTPNQKLVVTSGATDQAADFDGSSNPWISVTSSGVGTPMAGIGTVSGSASTVFSGAVSNHPYVLRTNNTERMRIDAAGNVGIGTATPQYPLDVVGNANFSGTVTGGNIVAKYQDVAEWVPANKQMPAGTVVVLDPEKSNHVISSSKSYDTRVAGVISARPGLALGEGGAGKVLVATTGRVRVKVDATHSAISIGDLLVTSDKEGLAMKSEPVVVGGRPFHSPGTLIGKALEPLAKGTTGEILVLLSLQ